MGTPSRSAGATALAISGLAFAAYPLLRPYGPEVGAPFAADLASEAWLVAHVLGMVGFTAFALACRSLTDVGTSWDWGGRPLREVETRMWLALAMLLPYYGAEAYGLGAVGRYALDGDPGVLAVAESFRYAPFEVTTFSAGLLLLMAVGGRLLHGTWAHVGERGSGGCWPASGSSPTCRSSSPLRRFAWGTGSCSVSVSSCWPSRSRVPPSLRGPPEAHPSWWPAEQWTRYPEAARA